MGGGFYHLVVEARDAWIVLARSGAPGLPGGRWAVYDPERRATMILSRECPIEFAPGDRQRQAWDAPL